MRNCGIIVTWNGTISVVMISTNRAVRPRNRIRANAYPASEHSTRLQTTVTTATMALFRKNRPNGAACQACGVIAEPEHVRGQDRREVQRLGRRLQ